MRGLGSRLGSAAAAAGRCPAGACRGRGRGRCLPHTPSIHGLLPCDAQGNKTNNLAIVYTPASNLRKSGDMAVGQVRRAGGCGACCAAARTAWPGFWDCMADAASAGAAAWLQHSSTHGLLPAPRAALSRPCAWPCTPYNTNTLPKHTHTHTGGLPRRPPREAHAGAAAAQRGRQPAEQDAGVRSRMRRLPPPPAMQRPSIAGSAPCHPDSPRTLVQTQHTALTLPPRVCTATAPQEERFLDLAAERAAWEKEQAGKRKAEVTVSWGAVGVRASAADAGVQRRMRVISEVAVRARVRLPALPRLPVQAQLRSEKDEKEEQRRQQDMLGAAPALATPCIRAGCLLLGMLSPRGPARRPPRLSEDCKNPLPLSPP